MNWTLFVSFLSAVLSGVLMRIFFEQFDEKYRKPVRSILELRRRIISALTMYAHMYTNPGLKLNPDEEVKKLSAAWDVRHLAAELDGAIASLYEPCLSEKGMQLWFERIRKRLSEFASKAIPTSGALRMAKDHLIRLSNSFYDTHVVRDKDAAERNDETAEKIRDLLTKRIDDPAELAKFF